MNREFIVKNDVAKLRKKRVVTTTIRLTNVTLQKVKERAAKEDRTQSSWLQRCIEKAVGEL